MENHFKKKKKIISNLKPVSKPFALPATDLNDITVFQSSLFIVTVLFNQLVKLKILKSSVTSSSNLVIARSKE